MFVFSKEAVLILQMRPAQLWSDPNAPLFQKLRRKNMVSFMCAQFGSSKLFAPIILAHGSFIY